jgi:hypothetical protein
MATLDLPDIVASSVIGPDDYLVLQVDRDITGSEAQSIRDYIAVERPDLSGRIIITATEKAAWVIARDRLNRERPSDYEIRVEALSQARMQLPDALPHLPLQVAQTAEATLALAGQYETWLAGETA